MSNHLSDLPVPIYKPKSPSRPKHQTHRSITETGNLTPTTSKLQKSHHVHHHIHRHKDKESGTSLQPHNNGAANLLDGSKSEGVTPDESRSASRRTSLLGAAGVSAEVEGSDIAAGWREERRAVKEGELEEEKEKGVLRATELRNALHNLNTQSNNTMMRLDTSYYSVLEKLSALQSTVTSMKELANMTKELNEDFKHESEEIIAEVEVSMEGLRNFEEQQTRIEVLTERVRKGRASIKTFGDRVEIVKDKVDGWEKGELEWQERTRRRLKGLWIIMAVCGVVFLGLMAFQYTPARTQGPMVMKGTNTSGFEGSPNYEEIKNEPWTLNKPSQDVLGKTKAERKSKEKEKVEDDPRLRLFDEL